MTQTSRRRAESREGMVVLTVALPGDVHRRLSHIAVDENSTLNELIRQAVDDWLARHESKRRKR